MSEGLQHSYDSIGAAAAALSAAGVKCSKGSLRKEKKEGAPGFRGSRVYPGELVPWLQEKERAAECASRTGSPHPEGGGAAAAPYLEDKDVLEARRLRLQCEGLEIANAEKRGRLWDADVVKGSWLTHLRAARQALISMVTKLAPQIAGRPPAEVEALLGEAVAVVLARLRGNPYADGAVSCAGCGKEFELILDLPGPADGTAAAAGSMAVVRSKAKGKRKGKKHVRNVRKSVGGDGAEDGGVDPGAVRTDSGRK